MTGVRRVTELISKYGVEAFAAAGEESMLHSESLSRKMISQLPRGTFRATDYLEGPNGEDLRLSVRVIVSSDAVALDYEGTSPQVDFPLNAVLGVTISGAYFVLRCLLGDGIPANHGAFSPINVSAPSGCLLNPTSPHPVGAGNVETSQRNADVVLLAFSKAIPKGVPAAAGGSMNNVMLGGRWRNSTWAFYETIGVGLGGSSSRDGIDGIQCNMTNTMNTPIEEIERSYPLLMTRYEFRPDSAGAGRMRGGCGVVRTYRILAEETIFTVVADRGRHRPWGLSGGLEGAGTEVVWDRGGVPSKTRIKATLRPSPDDEITFFTAGGGGHGEPKSRSRAALRRDIESGLLSKSKARDDYGYVVPNP